MKVGASVKRRGNGGFIVKRGSKRRKGGPRVYFIDKNNRKFNQKQG